MNQKPSSRSANKLFSVILLLCLLCSSLSGNNNFSVKAQGMDAKVLLADPNSAPRQIQDKIIGLGWNDQISYINVLVSNGKRVGIQAGHWQDGAGSTCTNGTREVDINLAVANKAAEILRGRGYTVDVLAGLVTAVNYYSADVFIALHLDQCAAYYSGYKISRWKGQAGTGTDGSGDASDQWVNTLWSEYGNSTGLPRDTSAGHFTSCMREYYALNPVDGGPICEGLYQNRPHGISDSTPGAIIEMGWLSGDYNFVTSVDGQQKMGTGIANAVDKFLGEVSSCDASSIPSGYEKCAEEGSGNWCSFSGLKTVYYGANSCYAIEDKSNGVECINENFGGDPLPGVHKACYIQIDTCPIVSGLVRLYDGTNCNTPSVDVGLGLTQLESATYNFNDRAESIAIPNGWSARLYQNNNVNTNESTCLNSNDNNLNDNTYANGVTVSNNGVTWIRVYNNSTCYLKHGDANGDGFVDGRDYVIWAGNYAKTVTRGPADGDFDGNGLVDGRDYVIWMKNYNT